MKWRTALTAVFALVCITSVHMVNAGTERRSQISPEIKIQREAKPFTLSHVYWLDDTKVAFLGARRAAGTGRPERGIFVWEPWTGRVSLYKDGPTALCVSGDRVAYSIPNLSAPRPEGSRVPRFDRYAGTFGSEVKADDSSTASKVQPVVHPSTCRDEVPPDTNNMFAYPLATRDAWLVGRKGASSNVVPSHFDLIGNDGRVVRERIIENPPNGGLGPTVAYAMFRHAHLVSWGEFAPREAPPRIWLIDASGRREQLHADLSGLRGHATFWLTRSGVVTRIVDGSPKEPKSGFYIGSGAERRRLTSGIGTSSAVSPDGCGIANISFSTKQVAPGQRVREYHTEAFRVCP